MLLYTTMGKTIVFALLATNGIARAAAANSTSEDYSPFSPSYPKSSTGRRTALAMWISYLGSTAFVAIIEGKEKRFIRSAFGKYVSPAVVGEIANNPDSLKLGGQNRPISVFFSDLAGFTTMSERMTPEDLIAHLNEYPPR